MITSTITGNFATFIDVLRQRAIGRPEQVAYTFIQGGDTEIERLTYAELDRQARIIAATLQQLQATDARALLLYPPGLSFVAAFFGCLYARVVAVPVYPPRRNQSIAKLQAIMANSGATIALTTTTLLPTLQERLAATPECATLTWLTTDDLCSAVMSPPSPADLSHSPAHLADTWYIPNVDRDTLAFLQYTSGSTGTPKGVMISHGNLLHNSALIHQFFGHSPHSRGVIWLPPYHDMGLIGGVLQPLFGGFPVTLMSSIDFLQRPLRWLQAMTRDRATTSGGPNFAYDLCIRKITPEQRAQLDLSSWDVAFTGAEPVNAATLEQFATLFASCGFRREAFYPCYGMAETTLIISGGSKISPPTIYPVDPIALEQHRVVPIAAPLAPVMPEPESIESEILEPVTASSETGIQETGIEETGIEADRETASEIRLQEIRLQRVSIAAKALVSCGENSPDQTLRIVNPDTLMLCAVGEVGEIWVAGPSVAQGYWQQPEATKETFQAFLTSGEGPFLRTGDLGFVADGELFITGRLKEMMIIRGQNYYPQDIELTVENSHPALRSGNGAVFTIEVGGEERIVVVQEVERSYLQRLNAAEVIGTIRQAVTQEHALQVYATVLIKPGSIPKTSSGKIQRYACRNGFQSGTLSVVEDWSENPQTRAKFLRLDADVQSLLQKLSG